VLFVICLDERKKEENEENLKGMKKEKRGKGKKEKVVFSRLVLNLR